MGIIKAFTGAIEGTFADQWKDIVTAGQFDEHTVVSPGILKRTNNGRGSNTSGSVAVISKGSKIFVPENTAAFIFNQSGIEEIITTPGGYVYENGEESIFSGSGIKTSFINQVKDRISYGGQTSSETKIAFVNLREIRNIKFGTKGPLVYNDLFYETDLEVLAYGNFSLKISNPEIFIKNYVPANVTFYSFDNKEARAQILSEFLQSFSVALNSLSTKYRVSQLPSQANEIASNISTDSVNAGTWKERFGFEIVKIGIQNIEFSPDSRELVKQYSSNKMNIKAYDNVSQKASNISAQQKIAQGVQDHGLGDGAGMLFGMNMTQNLSPQAEDKSAMSLNEQIETVKKLKELLDAGILSQEEFDLKKKEIMML
jgi:membrane protease subunit (stomatin/prohibitin family)